MIALNKNQQTADITEKQRVFAELLVSRANSLYEIAEREEYWM